MCWSAAVWSTRARPRPCVRISSFAAASYGCEDMEKTVAVIGAVLIGRAWAMVFARAGWRVRLNDRLPAQLHAARGFIAASLDEQAGFGLVGDPSAALARIDYMPALEAALAGVDWVQENLPEVL